MRAWFRALPRSRRIALGLLGTSPFLLPAWNMLGPQQWAIQPPGRVHGYWKSNHNYTTTPPLVLSVAYSTRSEVYDDVQMTHDKKADYDNDPRLSSPHEHDVVGWRFQEVNWWKGLSQCVETSSDLSMTQHSHGGVNPKAPGDKYVLFKCTNQAFRPETWSVSIRESRAEPFLSTWKQHLDVLKPTVPDNVKKE